MKVARLESRPFSEIRLRVATWLVLGVWATASGRLLAHHGVGNFDPVREVTLMATVTEWAWSNPHCFLRFDASDDEGALKSWVGEGQNPADMAKRGWSRTALKVGDRVTLTLHVARHGGAAGRIVRVALPDGKTLVAIDGAPPLSPEQPRTSAGEGATPASK